MNTGATAVTSTKVCDDPEGIQGIMAYRNDCHFDNNPEIVEPGNEMPGMDGMDGMEGSSSTGGFNSQSWLSAEHSMSGMTPSSGSMNGPAGNSTSGLASGHGDGGHAASGSQDDGAATDLTSGSNSAVGNGNNGASSSTSGGGNGPGSGPESRSHLVAGGLADSGRGSYQASPVSPHQNMMGQGEQSQFFGDPGSFGMTPQAAGFGMSSGPWGDMAGQGDMSGQGDMQPVGDGVLRALINMGPMGAMDLSTWNPTNENMRR